MKKFTAHLRTLNLTKLFNYKSEHVRDDKFIRGFTLIETLVSFSIITILTGISLIAFSNYNEVQKMSQTATNIKLMINQARGNAQSIVKKVTTQSGGSVACDPAKLDSYLVTFDTNSVKLEIVCVSSAPQLVRTLVFPSGIVMSSYSCASPIVEFKSLPDVPTPLIPCNFVLTKDGATRTIMVDNNGNVEIL